MLIDNPLDREKPFTNAVARNLSWSMRGGGEKYSAFVSIGGNDENGTLPNHNIGVVSGQANFDFFAHEKLRMEFGMGLTRNTAQLPRNDNDIYGYLGGGLLGDPRTRGGPKDGWFGNNRQTLAIMAYENVDKTLRVRPRFAVNYSPFQWFTHRLTLGGDFVRTRAFSFWAKNDIGFWDTVPLNTGQIGEGRQSIDRLTFDYLGNVTHSFGENIRADFSFGSQILTNKRDLTNAEGQGLISNDVRTVSSASRLSNGAQNSAEDRQVGLLGQLQMSYKDKLYLQLGGRMDQSSSFAADSDPFYSPKLGVSYVISDENYFRSLVSEDLITTLRLRAAYGVTGRSPNSGVRSVYSPSTNQITSTGVAVGVVPGKVGNLGLRAEKGKELEVGFEVGLLNDRLGLDLTYFNKVTDDQILSFPLAPSLGIANLNLPDVNVGSLLNRGFEVSANARVLTKENLSFEVRGAVNTLRNEVIDLGETPPTTNRKEGFPIGGVWAYAIRSHDLTNNVTIVSDTLEFIGNGANLPGWETTLSATLTVFKNLSFYVQADGRGDRVIFNSTDQFRDRQNPFSELAVLGCAPMGTDAQGNCTDQAKEKYMAKFGCVSPVGGSCSTPWRTEQWVDSLGVTRGNRLLARTDVLGDYLEDGTFLKLREASVSYRVPRNLVERYVRAQSASFTLSMRNIAVLTDLTGLDPETDQFLTVPADRRWIARVNVTF